MLDNYTASAAAAGNRFHSGMVRATNDPCSTLFTHLLVGYPTCDQYDQKLYIWITLLRLVRLRKLGGRGGYAASVFLVFNLAGGDTCSANVV